VIHAENVYTGRLGLVVKSQYKDLATYFKQFTLLLPRLKDTHLFW